MAFNPKRKPPPSKVAVQLNVRIPYAYRAFLQKEARRRNVSFNRLIVDALAKAYPHSSVEGKG